MCTYSVATTLYVLNMFVMVFANLDYLTRRDDLDARACRFFLSLFFQLSYFHPCFITPPSPKLVNNILPLLGNGEVVPVIDNMICNTAKDSSRSHPLSA